MEGRKGTHPRENQRLRGGDRVRERLPCGHDLGGGSGILDEGGKKETEEYLVVGSAMAYRCKMKP